MCNLLHKLYFSDANKGNADSSGEEDSDDDDENTNKSQTETHDLVSNSNFNINATNVTYSFRVIVWDMHSSKFDFYGFE